MLLHSRYSYGLFFHSFPDYIYFKDVSRKKIKTTLPLGYNKALLKSSLLTNQDK